MSTNAAATTMSKKYQSMFPEVASLSSSKLINDTLSKSSDGSIRWNVDGENALLVDVRSSPERNVSMISGAISLYDFEERVLQNLVDTFPDVDTPKTIVMYCTIGYRSGMESRRLIHKYPLLFQELKRCEQNEESHLDCEQQSKLRIMNMDGVIPFANALESAVTGHPSFKKERVLIQPDTNRPISKVHVYGPSWEHCLSESYDPVMFSNVELAWRGIGVLCRSVPCLPYSCLTCHRKHKT
jgi:rhodanese-related sulfurtransferase